MVKKARPKREKPKRPPKVLGPTKPSQQEFALLFNIKNQDRKVAKAGLGYRDGRRCRAELAINGCFGKAEPFIYNQCVQGTRGLPRSGDNRED
jgi:hypothetical protein